MNYLFITLTVASIFSQIPHAYWAINNYSRIEPKRLAIAQNVVFCGIISVGILGFVLIGKSDQIIQPFYFGSTIPKTTRLWLKNLTPLKWSNIDTLFEQKTSREPEYYEYNSKRTKSGKSRYSIYGRLGSRKGKERSKFFPEVAAAMADQWGSINLSEAQAS